MPMNMNARSYDSKWQSWGEMTLDTKKEEKMVTQNALMSMHNDFELQN